MCVIKTLCLNFRQKGRFCLSAFSNKCDVWDSLIMIHEYTDEELANNVKIYQGCLENRKQLDIKSRRDLIPYYAHLVSSAAYDNVARTASINITEESLVDREERKTLEFRLDEILKIYDRCKRKKIDFDVEEAVKETVLFGYAEKQIREIANRVKTLGKKANIDGIHLDVYERYRKRLVGEMIKNGLNPLDYGDYERFL